jgi:hypothetical protein
MKQLKILLIIVVGVSLLCISHSVHAKVTGTCSNCHTMHNSQGGTTVAVGGTGTGWKDGKLVGTAQTTASAALTVSDCVGCHSSTTSDTIIELGGSRIPIVYNAALPAKPLAGGNFYWVVNGNSAYSDAVPSEFGHNVLGLPGVGGAIDQEITENEGAPGSIISGTYIAGCACHFSLATDEDFGGLAERNGCQGCHVKVSHHDDTKYGYRFLVGHLGDTYVAEGIEDPDWEREAGNNWYKGYTGTYSWGGALSTAKSITSYCAGCHGNFHDDMGSSATNWVRHPSDAALPDSGEYAGYDPVANYSKEAPAAFINPASPARADAVVMCLSCHRPHASPHPDMLRWDYSGMNAGGGGDDGTGCFVCHTNKDGS